MKLSVFILFFALFVNRSIHSMDVTIVSLVEKFTTVDDKKSVITFKASIKKDKAPADKKYFAVVERVWRHAQQATQDRPAMRGYLYPYTGNQAEVCKEEMRTDFAHVLFNAFSNAYIDQKSADEKRLALLAQEEKETAARLAKYYDECIEQPLDLRP